MLLLLPHAMARVASAAFLAASASASAAAFAAAATSAFSATVASSIAAASAAASSAAAASAIASSSSAASSTTFSALFAFIAALAPFASIATLASFAIAAIASFASFAAAGAQLPDRRTESALESDDMSDERRWRRCVRRSACSRVGWVRVRWGDEGRGVCVTAGVGGEGVWEVGASASGCEGLQRLQRQLNLLAELRCARQPRLARGRRLGVTRHDDV